MDTIDGRPFWGHGSEEHLAAGTTMYNEAEEDGEGDEGVQEGDATLGVEEGSESPVEEASNSDSTESVGEVEN